MHTNAQREMVQLSQVIGSRRRFLRLSAGGVVLLGGVAQTRTGLAQDDSANNAVDALFDSAAAMPHLWAEISFPFVRENWMRYGRGTLVYSLDAAVAAETVTASDAALLGTPTALYVASLIKPEGESWSTLRYVTIASYGDPGEASVAASRFVGAGVPAGGTDLTANLDPAIGDAISYAMPVDLSGTPGEQVFSIFAAGRWLFRYSSLTPLPASAADSQRARMRALAALPQAVGEDVADETGAIVAAALTFDGPVAARQKLRAKGFSDEEINDMSMGLFPFRFGESSVNRIDYPKHNNRDYLTYGIPEDRATLDMNYYLEAMCVVTDEGPIPPANNYYIYRTLRFFRSGEEANAYFDSMPTPAQDATHQASKVTFQDDPDGTSNGTITTYASWQPEGAPSTLPGYGFSRVKGPIVSHFNVFNLRPPADVPVQIDPANPAYQSLRTGVLDILEQQRQFESSFTPWPTYRTPDALAS